MTLNYREWFYRRTKFEIVAIILIPILVLLVIILSTTHELNNNTVEQVRCTSIDCIKAANKLTNIIDKNVNPCDNFYNFVCGNFINSDTTNSKISSFLGDYTDTVKRKLKRIVSEPANINDTKSLKLAKQLYQTCLLPTNEPEEWQVRQLVQDLGGWPLIDGNKWNESDFDWMQTMIKARELGLNFNWLLRIGEDGKMLQLNHPIVGVKLDDSGRKYERFLIRELAAHLLKNDHFNNDTEIDKIVDFKEKLTEIVSKVQLSDKVGKHLFKTVAHFRKKWPTIDWLNFFKNITMQKRLVSSSYLMNRIEFYFGNLTELLDKTPKRTVANYIIWRVLVELSSHMSKTIQTNVINRLLIVTKRVLGLSDLCYTIVVRRMEDVLESEYYRRNKIINFNSNPVLNYLLDEMTTHLRKNQWMDESTIENGVERIDELKKLSGGFENFQNATTFDKFHGYDQFEFSSHNIINMITQLQINEYRTKFSRISGRITLVPRIGFFDWSQANALFIFGYNTLVIGLGVLQDDFYKDGRPNYLNFGGIGWILSHELSHAFDNTFPKYIRNNRLVSWIDEKSSKEYEKRLRCVVDEYDRIVTGELHSNQTENIVEDSADFIAADVAYEAYQRVKGDDLKLPNLEYDQNQLFWIQYASFLCHKKITIPGILDNDVRHSLPMFRINGPLRNSKYFTKDFNCPLNSYMNPYSIKCDLI